MKQRAWIYISIVLVLALLMPACGPADDPEDDVLKAAFIYISPPGDLGWTYEHDRGRLFLEAQLGDQVQTTFIENIGEGPDASRVMRQYAQEGYDLVFATSFGYMDHMYEVAQEFPDVFFEHCSGFKTRDNMATYFGRMYQPRYLSGLVAGSMTENNHIGYVAAFPIPEVVRGINAFTLGVRKANPDAQVYVVWTSTWYDPVVEREAAVALLDGGADIIAQHQDTTEPQKAAQERGMLSIGYNSDMRGFVGDTVLTGPVWNWGVYYTDVAQDVLNDTWTSSQYWGSMTDGIVDLADFSPKVPQDVRDLVAAERALIVNGEWDVFCGPITDQAGNLAVAEGECMSDGDMLGIQFFVEGVVGNIQD